MGYDSSNKDEKTEMAIFRLLYILMIKIDDNKIVDEVLKALNFNGEIIGKYLNFHYPKTEQDFHQNALKFDQFQIIGRIILIKSNPLITLKKLSSLVAEKEFVKGALISDSGYNKNALEHAICKQKKNVIEYLMSFKDIKTECSTNKELVWRCIYWMDKNYNQSVAVYLMK